MSIFGIAIVGICGAVFALLLKKTAPEMSQIIALSVGAVIMFVICSWISPLISLIDDFASMGQISEDYLVPVLKITGIAYIAQFASEMCRDAGEGAIASQVEMAGKVAIALIALPIIKSVFSMIISIMN